MARALSGSTLRLSWLSLTPRLYRVPRSHQLEGLIAGSHPRADPRDTDPSKYRPGERKDILRTLIQLLLAAVLTVFWVETTFQRTSFDSSLYFAMAPS